MNTQNPMWWMQQNPFGQSNGFYNPGQSAMYSGQLGSGANLAIPAASQSVVAGAPAGMDPQTLAKILSVASMFGKKGGSSDYRGYTPMVQAESMPGNPNYRPNWAGLVNPIGLAMMMQGRGRQ